jgi:hypothetical protein
LKPGDKFTIGDVTVLVAGVFASENASDEALIYTHLDFLQRARGLSDVGQVTQFEVHLAEGADPDAVRARLHRPAALLWDGRTTWALLDGHPADLAAEAAAAGLAPAGAPDLAGLPERWSIPAAAVAALPGDGHGPFVAEVGVGVVHRQRPQPARPADAGSLAIGRRLKAAFDPTGRLAPGRSPW